MLRNLVSIFSLVFCLIFVVWVASLFFIHNLYYETSENDAPVIRDYLKLGYKDVGNWEFLSKLWDQRSSLLEVRIDKVGLKEPLYLSYRRAYAHQYVFKSVIVQDMYLDYYPGPLKLTLIYQTLPQEEVIYYSAIALAMLLSFLIVFFTFFARII